MRRGGFYWVRLGEEPNDWCPAEWRHGNWWVIGMCSTWGDPVEIGPRILREQEQNQNVRTRFQSSNK